MLIWLCGAAKTKVNMSNVYYYDLLCQEMKQNL